MTLGDGDAASQSDSVPDMNLQNRRENSKQGGDSEWGGHSQLLCAHSGNTKWMESSKCYGSFDYSFGWLKAESHMIHVYSRDQ